MSKLYLQTRKFYSEEKANEFLKTLDYYYVKDVHRYSEESMNMSDKDKPVSWIPIYRPVIVVDYFVEYEDEEEPNPDGFIEYLDELESFED